MLMRLTKTPTFVRIVVLYIRDYSGVWIFHAPHLYTNQEEHMEKLPKKGVCNLDGLQVNVRILAQRLMFGRQEYEIVPVSGGSESRWITAEKVEIK